MHRMHRILSVANVNLKKCSSNPRIYISALLILGYLYLLENPIRSFASAVNINVTPWIFPFLLNDVYSQMMIFLGIVLVFCDAPFLDSAQPYMILRSGKKGWLLGEYLYIMLVSVIYLLYVLIVSICLIFPVDFSNEWGKIIGTLTQTNAAVPLHIPLGFSYTIQYIYTPIGATLWTFLMAWLDAIFLGFCIFTINFNLNRFIGTAVAVVLILINMFALNLGGGKFLYFSPMSWSSLSNLDITNTSVRPSNLFAVCTLLVICVLLLGINCYTIRAKNIDVLPPL